MEENKLRSLADRQKIPLGTLEKDYALTNLLSIITHFPKLNLMVFKGGTALKKIHFKNFRFSEDLDFTCLEDVSEEFRDFIKEKMIGLDVIFTKITDEERKNKSFKFKIKYTQFNGRTTSVKVDLSLRKDLLTETYNKPVLHFYDTFSNTFGVPTMSLEEIMAEKVRALLYSKHPRHLHDLSFLNDQNIRLNPDMVRTKIKLAYGDEFSVDRFKEAVSEKEEFWKIDLQPLLPHSPPSFESVSEKILKIVTEAMK